MADTRAVAGLTPQRWDDEFFQEYVQENMFFPYMGTTENSVIQVKNDLTKMRGDSVTFALLNRLTGAGVTGTNTLEGNEEDLSTRSFKVVVDKIRHGVVVPEMEQQKSAMSLREAARSALKTWMMEKTRDDIITALGMINGVPFNSATASQRNEWVVDNQDRVQFGKLRSNWNATFATAAANVDNTDDKLTPSALQVMKRLAQTARPRIRPIEVKNFYPHYVVFCGPITFRDLSADATMTQANREARARGEDNVLFRGGDLLWDGMLIRQVDDIPVYPLGAGGINISPVYLCGAQALAVAYAKRTKTIVQDRDYEDKNGVAIEEIRGITKMIFGSGATDTADTKDHGVVTGFFAAVADS